MSIYLLKDTKKFRCDSENEAERIVNAFKERFDVTKFEITRKTKKDDEYYVVTLTVSVNDEKEPVSAFIEENN